MTALAPGELPARALRALKHRPGSEESSRAGWTQPFPSSPGSGSSGLCRSTGQSAWAPQKGRAGPCAPDIPGQQLQHQLQPLLLHREGRRFPYCSTKAALLGRCGWGLWCSRCQTPASIQTQVQESRFVICGSVVRHQPQQGSQ